MTMSETEESGKQKEEDKHSNEQKLQEIETGKLTEDEKMRLLVKKFQEELDRINSKGKNEEMKKDQGSGREHKKQVLDPMRDGPRRSNMAISKYQKPQEFKGFMGAQGHPEQQGRSKGEGSYYTPLQPGITKGGQNQQMNARLEEQRREVEYRNRHTMNKAAVIRDRTLEVIGKPRSKRQETKGISQYLQDKAEEQAKQDKGKKEGAKVGALTNFRKQQNPTDMYQTSVESLEINAEHGGGTSRDEPNKICIAGDTQKNYQEEETNRKKA